MSDQTNGPDLDGTITWRALLDETRMLLERSGVTENAQIEARWIIEEITGETGPELSEVLDGLATTRGVAKLDALVARRSAGEPIQYVLGHWAFRTIDLFVDPRVLIPRPETEIVTGLALDELDRLRPAGEGVVADLGTGSGAIGLSVAVERPGARVVLTDASTDALTVARANLTGLGRAARDVEITEGSWFDALPERYLGEFDVVISNPPYIGTGEELASSVLDWEPESALRAGESGMDDLLHLVENAAEWLRPAGSIVLEMAAGQTTVIAARGADLGYSTSIHNDLAGIDRAVVLRRGE